jgi:hypothetical protein
MLRILTVVTFFLLCASVGQAQSSDLMSDADYKVFLSQVEAVLHQWEAQLRGIDLEKTPQIPYTLGKSITDSQTVALTEVDNIRTYIHFQREKRTVYGELALRTFMGQLFEDGGQIVWYETLIGAHLTNLDKYEADLSALIARLATDAMERVRVLEQGNCHP